MKSRAVTHLLKTESNNQWVKQVLIIINYCIFLVFDNNFSKI